MMCREAIMVNQGVHMVRAVTLKCRAWTCELCAPDRQKRLVAEIKAGKPETFITLTVNPAWGDSPAMRARSLVDAWRVIVRAAKRRYGYAKLPYFCVFEATKAGEPHLHIVARVKWIDQAWLSEQMDKRMEAPIVDVRRVRGEKAVANYISKYVGKAPHRFETCKRYWRTQDWDVSGWVKPEREGNWNKAWELRHITLARQAGWWEVGGYDIEREGDYVLARYRGPPPWAGAVA